MKSFAFACILLLGVVCTVSAQTRLMHSAPRCLHEGSECDFHDWKKVTRAHPKENLRFIFAIKQQNLDQLDEIFWKVSTPSHEDYGKHLSYEELRALTTDEEAARAVERFLLDHDPEVKIESNTGDFITVLMPAFAAESMFSTQMHVFSSETNKAKVVRSLEYSLPEEIASRVDFVSHLTMFPPMERAKFLSIVEEDATGQTTPALINQYYGITNNKVTGNVSQGLFESLGQNYSPTDLQSFFTKFNIPSQKVNKLVGPNDPNACSTNPESCGEANLDIQYIMAVAQGAYNVYWSIAGSDKEGFLDWLVAMAATSDPPMVNSVSYGELEPALEASVLDRFSTEAQKLGTRGVTVIIASGDDGVANFQARGDKSKCGFTPSYPASCPYVTAVGATMGPETGAAETACTSDRGGLITTGGGFSTHYSMPDYQSEKVKIYLSDGPDMPPAGQFNNTGRGYPDVATLGHNYVVNVGGNFAAESGTSASAPVFAAMLTLVNDARKAKGKSPLGFVNPALYAMDASSFNDVTVGKNNCCAGQGTPVCCDYGFSAYEGWDPLSGLGSPKFSALMSALSNV